MTPPPFLHPARLALLAVAVMSMARASTFMDRSVGDPLRNQLVCYAEEVIDTCRGSARLSRTDPCRRPRTHADRWLRDECAQR